MCFNQLKIESKEHLELFYINHGTLFKTFVLQADLKYRIFGMSHTFLSDQAAGEFSSDLAYFFEQRFGSTL